MKTQIIAALSVASIFTAPALAHDFKIGDLIVDHPMAFETPKTAMSGGGYFSVTNTGTTSDRLTGVRADFPKVALHTTEETDGVARMIHVDAIDIPAGETVTLAPGGFHVMFMGLEGDPFDAGEEIPATLIFENAGEIDVVFSVEERSQAHEMDHSQHGGSE